MPTFPTRSKVIATVGPSTFSRLGKVINIIIILIIVIIIFAKY